MIMSSFSPLTFAHVHLTVAGKSALWNGLLCIIRGDGGDGVNAMCMTSIERFFENFVTKCTILLTPMHFQLSFNVVCRHLNGQVRRHSRYLLPTDVISRLRESCAPPYLSSGHIVVWVGQSDTAHGLGRACSTIPISRT